MLTVFVFGFDSLTDALARPLHWSFAGQNNVKTEHHCENKKDAGYFASQCIFDRRDAATDVQW